MFFCVDGVYFNLGEQFFSYIFCYFCEVEIISWGFDSFDFEYFIIFVYFF